MNTRVHLKPGAVCADPYFVMEVPRLTEYRYAWFEVARGCSYSKAYARCPACGGAVGSLMWQPPYDVVLKQARRVGDFVGGFGGPELLVSTRFSDLYRRARLTGIARWLPVTVRMLGARVPKANEAPSLLGVYFSRRLVRADWSKMGVKWLTRPKVGYCRVCGPGGGGRNGCYSSIERIAIDPKTLGHAGDMFQAMNLHGEVLVSARARQLIEDSGLENAHFIRLTDARCSFFE
ncbi:MAG: hypothetical protein AABZ53_11955 [Planctomycetota bacterium]